MTFWVWWKLGTVKLDHMPSRFFRTSYKVAIGRPFLEWEHSLVISTIFGKLASGSDVRCTHLDPSNKDEQSRSPEWPPHIVVATPPNLSHFIDDDTIPRFSLSMSKYLVLDEADMMLVDELMPLFTSDKLRKYLFSGRMTKKVEEYMGALKDPVTIDLQSKFSPVDTLVQHCHLAEKGWKDCFLVYLLKNEYSDRKSMVFTSTCDETRLLALMLKISGITAIPITITMTQAKQLEALNKYKAEGGKVVICTDAASRGLDIPDVEVIINYALGDIKWQTYMHRVARTARAGRAGTALTLAYKDEVSSLRHINTTIGSKFTKFPISLSEAEAKILFELTNTARSEAEKILASGGARGDDAGATDPVDAMIDIPHLDVVTPRDGRSDA